MFLRIGKKKTGDVKTNSKDDVSRKASELSKQNSSMEGTTVSFFLRSIAEEAEYSH